MCQRTQVAPTDVREQAGERRVNPGHRVSGAIRRANATDRRSGALPTYRGAMASGRVEVGPIRVAWIDAAECVLPSPDVLDRLGRPQAGRYELLRGTAARRFLAGRWLLLELIGEMTDVADPGFTTTCERCGADHGRPRLERAPVAVSIGYAGSMVAVAAAAHADAAAVGVDIEREPIDGAQAQLHRLGALFAPAPVPDTVGWTLLEAALKADGRGVAVDLAEVRIGVSATGRQPEWRPVWIPGRPQSVDAVVVTGPPGFVLSAAMVPAAERHPV